MRRLIRWGGLALALVFLLVAVCVVRTLLVEEREAYVTPASEVELDSFALSKRLGHALRVRTVSLPGEFDRNAFIDMERVLGETFPRAHAALTVEDVGERGRLYRFSGRDSTLPPVLLAAHLDVVPVEAATRDDWTRDPFSGELAGGFVWGRGTLDDKGSAVAMLEAVEAMLRKGQMPNRDVYLAFGYDEEIGGEGGAKKIAALLAERGIEPLFVLDEGMFVLEGVFPGLDAPLAAIGVAEKGELLLLLEVELEGGHAAMPPKETAIGLLSRALERLEAQPMPAAIDPPLSWMLERILPELPFAKRVVLANTWLTAPLVKAELLAGPATAASIRTTTAVTIVEGGVAPNVLPGRASAVVNLRVHPRDTLEEVRARVLERIDDERVKLSVLEERPASAISAPRGEAYELIERTILQVFPGACVVPALCVAGTDARHYAGLTDNIYRFLPLVLQADDLARIHGVNERVSLAGYGRMVTFYVQLFRNL